MAIISNEQRNSFPVPRKSSDFHIPSALLVMIVLFRAFRRGETNAGSRLNDASQPLIGGFMLRATIFYLRKGLDHLLSSRTSAAFSGYAPNT
jgi:hypothetical protein